jgi:hypothetical protein
MNKENMLTVTNEDNKLMARYITIFTWNGAVWDNEIPTAEYFDELL